MVLWRYATVKCLLAVNEDLEIKVDTPGETIESLKFRYQKNYLICLLKYFD